MSNTVTKQVLSNLHGTSAGPRRFVYLPDVSSTSQGRRISLESPAGSKCREHYCSEGERIG